MKLNSESELSKNPKDNVVKWLKDKFFSSLENEEDKWENFKSLCEEQKPKETKSGKDMVNEHARLCFLDTGNDPKGYLWNWYQGATEIAPNSNISFLDMNKKNVELWNSFKNKYPDANPADKFDEWYPSTDSDATIFKAAVDKSSSSS